MNEQKKKRKPVATKKQKTVETPKKIQQANEDKPSTSRDNVNLFSSFLKVKKALMRNEEEEIRHRLRQQQHNQNTSWHQPQRDPTPPIENEVYYIPDSDEEQEMSNVIKQNYQRFRRNEAPMEMAPRFGEPLAEYLVPAAITEEEVSTTKSQN